MRTANLISSFLVLALAGAVYAMTFSFPKLEGFETGPAFFPKLLCGLLAILGILLLIQSLRDQSAKPEGSIRGVLAVMGLMFVYLLLFTWLGFMISTPIIVILFLLYVRIRRWIPLVSIPVGITLFVYLVFEKFLGVPLPGGQLFG